MSVRRMTLGAGYRYLMSSVARGDGDGRAVSALTRYYAQSGTPPGRFAGAGLAGLADGAGVEAGSVVGEGGVAADAGRACRTRSPAVTWAGPRCCVPRTSTRTGWRHAAPKPVAGFDLTFSVPKSVSVAWALADPATREAVYGAHRAAVERVLRFAEEQVFCSRVGKAGAAQIDLVGVVAAVFDHWDSRAGDPQLHSHVVVLNRAQGVDGKWRTLDSRAVFRSTVALSELYNGVLSDYLTASAGVGVGAGRPAPLDGAEVRSRRRAGDVAGGVLAPVDGHRGRQERVGRPVREGPRPGAHRPGGPQAAADGHPGNAPRQAGPPLGRARRRLAGPRRIVPRGGGCGGVGGRPGGPQRPPVVAGR